MTISFTNEETQHIQSLFRIANAEDNRVVMNATMQAAEDELLRIFGNKIVDAPASQSIDHTVDLADEFFSSPPRYRTKNRLRSMIEEYRPL
ncbi:hypothetical protein [Rhodococcoides fascians]|uniref:hypothetical protein n=1 Tax=Rhodococcoides fascians TaxID=1828 RepID=UPI001DF86E74|nr:hypothetical protein [Rhodococcus fascians]CAH0190580.1 hypothetical protein SRABI91_01663 [Rhodococcus fascians]